MKPLPVFFGEEWERLKEGIAGLDPITSHAEALLTGQRMADPAAPKTITIPGWDQVVKLGPRIPIPPGSMGEYYKAKKENRYPNLDPAVLAAVEQLVLTREAHQSSSIPAWAQSWGQIMTALDNVQDFASTVATIGRLGIWAAPKLGARAVPVVGWIVLAADVLNAIGFLGMIAMPLYALLCNGPREALVAGIPAALLKSALCREAWTMARLNPLSRAGRSAAKLRALGKLPGIGNLIEVAQTTDNLFGYGLSIGALYGTAMETIFALARETPLKNTELNTKLLTNSIGGDYIARARAQRARESAVYLKAAGITITAPAIAGKTDLFTDGDHLLHLAVQLAALSLVYEFFDGLDHPALMAELLPGMWDAPAAVPSWWNELDPRVTPEQAGIGHWWIDGTPRALPGAQLIPALAEPVTRAVKHYLLPRRGRVDSTFYGAAVNQLTDNWWYLIGEGEDSIRWRLEPDFLILSTLAVEGLLLRQNEALDRVWKFWTSARALVIARDYRMLERHQVLDLANAAGVCLMRLLPIDAPFPAEWQPFFDHPERYTSLDVGGDPPGTGETAAALPRGRRPTEHDLEAGFF
jgi:hypothetical protein